MARSGPIYWDDYQHDLKIPIVADGTVPLSAIKLKN